MRPAHWLGLGVSALAVAALAALLPTGWIGGAEGALAGWRPWLGVARMAGIATAWLWWDALAERVPGIGAEGAAYLKDRRGFWIGALIAVELVLVRNVAGALWLLAA